MFVDAALCTPGWCARSSSRLRRLAQQCLTGGAMRLLLLPRYVNIIYIYIWIFIHVLEFLQVVLWGFRHFRDMFLSFICIHEYICMYVMCTCGALRLLPLSRYVHFISICICIFTYTWWCHEAAVTWKIDHLWHIHECTYVHEFVKVVPWGFCHFQGIYWCISHVYIYIHACAMKKTSINTHTNTLIHVYTYSHTYIHQGVSMHMFTLVFLIPCTALPMSPHLSHTMVWKHVSRCM